MRALLDANVLLPSILRETLLGAAAAGGFAPLWSARILEEWARAARRRGPETEAAARAAIAGLRAAWPQAEIPPDPDLEARLSLPDPDDRHVLAAAIAGGADALVTRHRADFPPRTLARYGITLRDPDGLLCDLAAEIDMAAVAGAVRDRAAAMSDAAAPAAATPAPAPDLRALLKRAGLPRLGKALAGSG